MAKVDVRDIQTVRKQSHLVINKVALKYNGTPYFVDIPLAEKIIGFISMLKHTGGSLGGVNFQLLDFQTEFIVETLAVLSRITKFRKHKTVILFVPRKQGKALPLDTPIPTPAGFKLMGDIKVGSTVFDAEGKPCKVTYESETFIGNDCYKISFSDGTSMVADAGHLWEVKSNYHWVGKKRKTVVLNTKEMIDLGVLKPRKDKGIERAFSIKLAGAIQGKKKNLPIAPYLLGYWLGDGSSFDARLTIGKDQQPYIIPKLNSIGCTVELLKSDIENGITFYAKTDKHYGTKNNFSAKLGKLNLKRNKHIPIDYIFSTIEDRYELLKGLIDSDGYVGDKGRVEYTTTLKQLADDVAMLARSLGYKTNIRVNKSTHYGKDCGLRYRVYFNISKGDDISVLPHKSTNWVASNSSRGTTIQITDITPVKSVPTKCIQVNSKDHLFIAGDSFKVTHNTELLAAMNIWLYFGDQEKQKEQYIIASETTQAAILFAAMVSMIKQSPALEKRVDIWKSTKTIESDLAGFVDFFRVLSSTAGTKDGLKASVLTADEAHAYKDSALYDVMSESMAHRDQPLAITISTAGYNRHGFFFRMLAYAKQVMEGIIKDDSVYLMDFSLGLDEDWTLEENWIKCNPALGYGVKLDYLRDKFTKAMHSATEEVSFKTKHLCMWVDAAVTWIKQTDWLASNKKVITEADLIGRECYGGLDLSSVTDLTAVVYVFPNEDKSYDVLCRFFIPSENAIERSRTDRVSYLDWIKEGYITTTEGNVIDYEVIETQILDDAAKFDIKEMAFDRWNSHALVTNLEQEGMTMVGFGQGYKSMSSPVKEIEALVLKKMLNHGNNPVLDWNISNVAITQDAADNVKMDKSKAIEKIDGAVALAMAIGRAAVHIDETVDLDSLIG